MLQDNFTEHEVQVFRSGSSACILLPDGNIVGPVTNAKISSNSGSSFWVEPYAAAGNTDAITMIRDVWVGTDQVTFPTQQYLTRKAYNQLARWNGVLQNIYSSARAVGIATMPYYMTSSRTIGIIIFLLGSADATGSTTLELRANGTTISGTSVTITAGATQGTISGSWIVAAGTKLTVYITSVGGTPGIGTSAHIIEL